MKLTDLDLAVVVIFLLGVLFVSLWASKREESEEDYFLAGRNLSWWLIGMSLLASNISSEHFIGMNGKGFELGLAIASFEWIAAITLVLIAVVLLPHFLRKKIYTMPQFLEFTYGPGARLLMSGYLLVLYVVGAMAGVLYTGGIALSEIFGMDLYLSVWVVGLFTGFYTMYGGLKAVVWTDLIQGTVLIFGGLVILYLGLEKVGGLGVFLEVNQDKLHMVLPWNHPELPWTIFLAGIWIPNFCYWGLNQFIVQRSLAARTVSEGQRGLIFAAGLKLLMPFIVVFPGILAFQIYGSEISSPDKAFPHLVNHLVPEGLRGLIVAAIVGAFMSTLDSVLNSASTLFTMDFMPVLKKRPLSHGEIVRVGRITTVVFTVLACFIAPELRHFGAIYAYMQTAWNFIWPGILACFVLALTVSDLEKRAGVMGLLISVPIYYLSHKVLGMAYLNASAFSFVLTTAVMVIFSYMRQGRIGFKFGELSFEGTWGVKLSAIVVVLFTLALYAFFW